MRITRKHIQAAWRGVLRAGVLSAAPLAVSLPLVAQPAGVPSCPVPGAPVVEPYRWYPKLDLARVPFHAGAGPWGPRVAIVAPEPPVTTRTVRVKSAAQFVAEARIPGTHLVVDASYIGPVVLMSDVADLDIEIGRGRTVAQLVIGRYSPPSASRRVRIRGETPGSHSGGVVGGITFYSADTSDVIIDGVDLNGDDGKGGALLWHFARGANRAAIVNVRGHAVSDGANQRGSKSVVVAGNRLYTGARSREVNGALGGYALRGGDTLVVYDNRIDGNRYHRVRVHPEPGPPQYAWLANNTFVDPHEARIFSAFNAGTTNFRHTAVWAVCNQVYAYSKCITPSFEGKDADYAMLTSNAFYGTISQALQQAQQAQHGAGRDYLTGNTFSDWRMPPGWTAPGDPTKVPLPALQPGRYNAALSFKPCPGP